MKEGENPDQAESLPELFREDARIRAALIHQLYIQGSTAFIGAFIGVVVLTISLWNQLPRSRVIFWVVAYVLVHVLRQISVRSYFKAGADNSDTGKLEREFAYGNVAAGLLWGVAAVALFPENSPYHQYLLALIIFGISCGAAAFYWSSSAAYFPTILVELLPLAGRFLYKGDETGVMTGIAILIFCVVVLLMARHLNSFGVESLRLRFEKESLFHSLQESRDELETKVEQRTKELSGVNEALCSEIDERSRAEESLRKSEEKYRLVVDNAEESIFVAQDGILKFVNPKTAELSGYSQSELLSKQLAEFVHPEDRELVLQKHEKRLKEGEFAGNYGFRIMHKTGGVRWVEISSVVIQWDGRPAALAFMTDVTDRKRAEEEGTVLRDQLRESQKMEAIGTLAGGIAHDFNNLLQVILGYSDLLLEQKYPENPEYDDLQKIYQAASSGAELVRRILTFSRKIKPDLISTSLNKHVRNVEKLLRRTIPKMIDIRLEVKESIGRINADPSQIEQVIINLALNARDAVTDEGSITIQTLTATLDEDYCRLNPEARPGNYALLSVSDTGHGMDRDTLQHIFEPFFTTKEMGKGTGLGLAMVYGIVKQHGGHITCHSEAEKGATFNVYFPLISSESEAVSVSSEEIPVYGDETILLVDDEDSVRELGERILRKAGYTVVSASSGLEAVRLYKRQQDQILCAFGSHNADYGRRKVPQGAY